MAKKGSLLGTVGIYLVPIYLCRSKIDRAGSVVVRQITARVTIWAYLSPSGNRFGGKNLRTRRETFEKWHLKLETATTT